MSREARRLLSLLRHRLARRALLMVCLLHAGMAHAEAVASAQYADSTGRYPHAVLGDDLEYGSLLLTLTSGKVLKFVLPDALVFEDTAPRVVDLDGDGAPEVIVVESDQSKGARLAIYDVDGRVAVTPFIGTRFRWLAPVGAADLDGDGRMEIAYIDRPHLAKTLRLWRYEDRKLEPVASLEGLTNHRIGETDIAGGIRTCAGQPEVILANATWSAMMAVRLEGDVLQAEVIGADTSREAFGRALACAS